MWFCFVVFFSFNSSIYLLTLYPNLSSLPYSSLSLTLTNPHPNYCLLLSSEKGKSTMGTKISAVISSSSPTQAWPDCPAREGDPKAGYRIRNNCSSRMNTTLDICFKCIGNLDSAPSRLLIGGSVSCGVFLWVYLTFLAPSFLSSSLPQESLSFLSSSLPQESPSST